MSEVKLKETLSCLVVFDIWWWSNLKYLTQLCNTQTTESIAHKSQLWQSARWMLWCSSKLYGERIGQNINIISTQLKWEHAHLVPTKVPARLRWLQLLQDLIGQPSIINLIGFDKPIKITFIFIKVICMSIAFLATPSNQARHMLAPAGVFISEYKNVLSPIDNW